VFVIVFDHNEKEGWQLNTAKKSMFYFLPFYYPKESISQNYVRCYPLYKLSFVVGLSSILLVLVGSNFGEFCVFSKP